MKKKVFRERYYGERKEAENNTKKNTKGKKKNVKSSK